MGRVPHVPRGSRLQRGRPDGCVAGSGAGWQRLASFPLVPLSGPGLSSRSWRRILCSFELLCQAGITAPFTPASRARVRALAESSTGANGQTLVSSSEASDKFHLSVYEEKYFSAFYFWL